MRTLIIATGIAALAAFPALAQTGVSRTTGSPGTTTTISGNGTTTSATGTNGSTVTTSDTSTASTAGNATSTTSAGNATSTSSAFSVQTLPPSSGTSGVAGGSGNATNFTTDPTAAANARPAFGPGGSFSNDSGNRALGLSPGQTSSGTLAGNSSTGIANAGEPVGSGVVGTLVPEGNVSIIGGGSTGFAGTAVQQQAAPAPQAQTPLFDQVAREGLAKEQRRRARGEEPRIIGIAPRTEADLSWQMPDDKIIRY